MFNSKLTSTLYTSTTCTLVSVSLLPLSIVQGSLSSGYPLAFETLCPSDTSSSAFPFVFSVAFSSALPLVSISYLPSELVSCLALYLVVSALDDLPIASGLSPPPRSASPSVTWLVQPPIQAVFPQIVAMLILTTFPTPKGRGARPSVWPFNSRQLCSSAGTMKLDDVCRPYRRQGWRTSEWTYILYNVRKLRGYHLNSSTLLSSSRPRRCGRCPPAMLG